MENRLAKTSLNVTRRIMCVCLEDLLKIHLLFIILYSDDSCEGAGGGLIKSHYCPYLWILFICLFVGFLLNLPLEWPYR